MTKTNNHHRPMTVIMITMTILAVSSAQPPPSPAEFGPGPPRVDLKMAIVMVLLVTVFFILGFLSVYTRQCAQHRFQAGRVELGFPGPGGPPGAWVQTRGLDPAVIETFPTFLYSSVKGLKLGKGSLECAVCLSEFEDCETLRLIPKCDHVFHPDCIDAWLVSHSTCPVCRANLVPKPGEPSLASSTLAELLSPVQGHDPVRVEAVEEPRLNRDASKAAREEESPAAGLAGGDVDQAARPPRSRSTGFGSAGWRLGGIFPRSHSTGHSLVRPGESRERFTLRLPEDVRIQLVANSVALNRARSAGAGAAALPRAASSRRGYRSGSVRRKDGAVYERFEPDGKDGRWIFSVVPPFVSRTGSVRSWKAAGGDHDAAGRNKAGSSSSDYVGERSTDPLRAEDQV